MQAKSFSLGAQEYLLEAVAVRCGDDLTGRYRRAVKKQHIGAVAVGVPRPSLKDKKYSFFFGIGTVPDRA